MSHKKDEHTRTQPAEYKHIIDLAMQVVYEREQVRLAGEVADIYAYEQTVY